jgi:hypothetical protein
VNYDVEQVIAKKDPGIDTWDTGDENPEIDVLFNPVTKYSSEEGYHDSQ